MGIVRFCLNRKVLAYIGGIATATWGVKILKSAPVRKAAVCIMASGMKLHDNAMSAFEAIKEDAEDLYHEACQKSDSADDVEPAE